MKNFKTIFAWIGLMLAPVFLLGYTTIHKSAESFDVRVVTADEAVPVYANDPQYFRSNNIKPHYNEVCIKANYAATTESIYISTFSTTSDATDGWPLVGTEKECHDWDQGVPIYVWRENVGLDKEVRFLFVR